MKKLMIAACAVAFAAAAQASSVTWKEVTSSIFDGTGTTAVMAQYTPVYLFIGDTTSADTLVKNMTASDYSTTVSSAAAAQHQLNKYSQFSKTGASVPSLADGLDGQKAYFVLFNGNNMYVSDIADAVWNDLGSNYDIAWGDQTDASKAAAKMSSGGYKGQGWYTVSAVPEPTSGLLLLLGVAGLALKRKRA